MRRAVSLVALLALCACYGAHPPVIVDPLSTRGPSLSSRSAFPRPACREIARSRCSSEACKGGNMDYVTLSCAGGQKVNRCVANLGCSAR
jgi:hypothetical protein